MEQLNLKRCGKCGIEKSTSEFHVDKNHKSGLQYLCKDCKRIESALYREINRGTIRSKATIWRRTNPEKCKTFTSNHYKAHPEMVVARNMVWRNKNPGKYEAIVAAWAKANPGRRCANEAKRRAAKLRATLPGIDQKEILAFYEEAARRTVEEGQPFHVDHIVPLQGETVCGLHVPWNLCVMVGRENISKHNYFTS